MAYHSISSFSTENICFNPLTNSENVSAIKTLSKLIKSSIGPCGKLKIIRNTSGGHTIITSSSQRLFVSWHLKNILLKTIISAAKSHSKTYNDSGLQCVYLILSSIERFLSCDIPTPLKPTLYEYYMNIFLECLTSKENSCSLVVDITNFHHLKSVVLSILSTKPGCLLSHNQKNHLLTLLLKAFLHLFPNSTTILDTLNMRFLSFEGVDVKNSQLYSGLLIQVNKTEWAFLAESNQNAVKVAFFTVSLAGDIDFPVENLTVSTPDSLSAAILKHLRGIALKLIAEEVKFVFCQKVVHPNFKKILHDAGVAVFDQLGSETSGYLQYTLGYSINSSLFTELSFGTISCSKIQLQENYYILVQTKHHICSLILCHYNEEALLELMIVCKQIISSLYHLLKNPRVCFGAGCTDIYTTITSIKKLKSDVPKIAAKFGCSSSKAQSALHFFLLTITDMALSSHQGSSMDFVIETMYGHLWKAPDGNYPSNDETCCCSRFTASAIDTSSWHHLNGLELVSDNFQNLNCESPPLDSICRPYVLDNLLCKFESYKLAADTASSFLKTDLCLFTGRGNIIKTNS